MKSLLHTLPKTRGRGDERGRDRDLVIWDTTTVFSNLHFYLLLFPSTTKDRERVREECCITIERERETERKRQKF